MGGVVAALPPLELAPARVSMMPCSRAEVRSCVAPGSAGEAHSSRPSGSARTWTFMPWCRFLPEKLGPLERSGRSPARCRPGSRTPSCGPSLSPRRASGPALPGPRSLRGCSGRRSRSRCRTRPQAARGVTAPQVGEGEQGLASCSQPPPGPDLPASSREFAAQVAQLRGGQIYRRRVHKHTKLLAGQGGSWP